MKLILILVCLTLYVTLTESCRGQVRPSRQNCTGKKDEGTKYFGNCRRDRNYDMWYYDKGSRSCLKLNYKGCGGNNNRYCTLDACRRKCVR